MLSLSLPFVLDWLLRSFEETWGNFDNNDDVDSVWGFNAKASVLGCALSYHVCATKKIMLDQECCIELSCIYKCYIIPNFPGRNQIMGGTKRSISSVLMILVLVQTKVIPLKPVVRFSIIASIPLRIRFLELRYRGLATLLQDTALNRKVLSLTIFQDTTPSVCKIQTLLPNGKTSPGLTL